MTATVTPKPRQTTHVFTIPVVREIPRPVEPAWYASTW